MPNPKRKAIADHSDHQLQAKLLARKRKKDSVLPNERGDQEGTDETPNANEQFEGDEVEQRSFAQSVVTDQTKKKKKRKKSNKKVVVQEEEDTRGVADEDEEQQEQQQQEERAIDENEEQTLQAESQEAEDEDEDDDEVSDAEGEEILDEEALKFDNLPINDSVKQALRDMKLTRMTQIQARAIPQLLTGKDLMGAAKTGSGKTLAFLIPALELIRRAYFKPRNGTAVIIVTPTRELALQIFTVAGQLFRFTNHTIGILIGGVPRKAEADKLMNGVNLIVCTPGRLLDHLQNTRGWVYRHLKLLILDEADRILDVGFEQDLTLILQLLPKMLTFWSTARQTALFSATQTRKINDLAKLSFTSTPVYIGVDDNKEIATVDTLEQGYVIVESDRRFLLLFTFLKKNLKKKIIVFLSSCFSVQFHSELLVYIGIPNQCLHGEKQQKHRTTTFFEFCNAESGILLCTDVAARGVDIPDVDWIIQYDPPDHPKEYIHRVGRTARAGGRGRALLFLLPSEVDFLRYLKMAKVPLNEYEFPPNKVANIQTQLEAIVEKNYNLYKLARMGYRSYILAYSSHALKDSFNVHNLDLVKVAKGFGFSSPPKVDLSILK